MRLLSRGNERGQESFHTAWATLGPSEAGAGPSEPGRGKGRGREPQGKTRLLILFLAGKEIRDEETD